MAVVPKLGALVTAFLAKFDVPRSSRDEELTVFEVADELHETALRERRDHMVDIQGLAEEANKSYELGRSAAMTEGLDETKAMYERQMVANTVQTTAHWTLTKKLQEILADMRKAEAERKEEKQNHSVDADAVVAAADVEVIDGTEAAEDLAKMAAEARAAADAAKAAAEAAADAARAAAEAAAAAAAAAEAAAARALAAAATRPESGLADSPTVRQRIEPTRSERKTKHKKETKMKFPKPFANKAHKPGIEEARARREKIVKLNNGTYYSEIKKKPAWR